MYALEIFNCLGGRCVLYLATNKDDLYQYMESIFDKYKDTTAGYTLLLIKYEEDIVIDYWSPWNSKAPYKVTVLESYFRDDKQGKYIRRDE